MHAYCYLSLGRNCKDKYTCKAAAARKPGGILQLKKEN